AWGGRAGEARGPAAAVAEEVGIPQDAVAAEVSPEGKAALVFEHKQAGATVAMVGDGINDAPALASADVGIAIGGGSEVVVGAADVTLARAELGDVVAFLRLARRTMRIIRQNLGWAFGYNLLALLLAASGILGHHAPMLAAAAMALSSLCVVSNSLRLREGVR